MQVYNPAIKHNLADGLVLWACEQMVIGTNFSGVCACLLFAYVNILTHWVLLLLFYFLERNYYLCTNSMLNLSDITSEVCTIAMSVIVDYKIRWEVSQKY
jgi:hypothetical protein